MLSEENIEAVDVIDAGCPAKKLNQAELAAENRLDIKRMVPSMISQLIQIERVLSRIAQRADDMDDSVTFTAERKIGAISWKLLAMDMDLNGLTKGLQDESDAGSAL